MPMIQQPMYVADRASHSASASVPAPVMVQPVVMNTPSPQQMEFTVEETSAWLHELCIMRQWNKEAEMYKNIFLRHQICGDKMKALNFEDLTVLGIKEEHREELLQAISQAFEEQNNFYNQQYMAAQMQPMCMTP